MNLKKKSRLDGIFSLRYLFYDFAKWTGAPSAMLFIRPSVRYVNKESVQKLKGGFIISSNHLQYLDPIVIHCAFPKRRLFFVTLEKLFDTPFKSWFFRSINCIKLDRKNTGIETIREVGEVLQAGKAVCIFPEGKISSDAKTDVFKPGCAMMSVLNNAPVLPVRLEKRRSVFCCTRIIVGEPVYPEKILGSEKSIMAIEKLNQYLYEKEQELCNINI